MQTTLDPTSELVDRTKRNFDRFSARLLHLLSFVPDDKLTWTPSPTAKSPLRIVAHCALTSQFFADAITGKLPQPMPSPEEFFGALHEGEGEIATRAEAIALVERTTAELGRALATVDATNIDAPRNSPFGPMPVRFWIDQGGEQLAGHAGQLEYLQTLWGDLDNHYG